MLTVTKPYAEIVSGIISLIENDPTEARERYPDADALAADLRWDQRENEQLFNALKNGPGRAMEITPRQLREALRRRKMEWAKKQQKEHAEAEKERKRLAKAERVIKVLGEFPMDARHYVALAMASKDYTMTWDRCYKQRGVPLSVKAILNDLRLTADSLALIKPKGDDLSTTSIEAALEEWSDLRRSEREAEVWASIEALPVGADAKAILEEFLAICKIYFKEPEFAFACIMKFIWSVKRRFARLDIEQIHLICLLGAQDSGKTTFCRYLLKPIDEVSVECSLQDLLDTRQMDMPSYLAAFTDEMVFADKVEASAFKNLLTGQTQARRPMRSNLSEKIAVRFTAIATSNKPLGDLIFDTTGMRRFVEVKVNARDATIEANWHRIAEFPWLRLWQAVDYQDEADPLVSRFKDLLKLKQEDMRRQSNVEIFAKEFEFSPKKHPELCSAAKTWNHQYITFYARELFELFHAWEKKNDPSWRGTSSTRFGKELKALIDNHQLPCWSHGTYGTRVTYALDYVAQQKLIDGEAQRYPHSVDDDDVAVEEVEAAD